MLLDSLEKCGDDELSTIKARCDELLLARDQERKEKALEQASEILAIAGLSLREVAAAKLPKNAIKAPFYRGGRQYQHPSNKALVWTAKGQKPNWLRELEGQGRKAVELAPEAANENAPPVVKKTG